MKKSDCKVFDCISHRNGEEGNIGMREEYKYVYISTDKYRMNEGDQEREYSEGGRGGRRVWEYRRTDQRMRRV